ncbi:thiolase family protein (plasmid) [Rhodococcus pyridinivorans]|uniref:thiolase family protein n=1 Tax=Rhodococcus TaxID=1827 RepID=UPI0007DA05E3|nr:MULTISPECIES: thiolase family protein [Rhodococcus]MCT7293663.1 thiolase family protein [Rhodococcus sp. PAE-6]QXU56445.1 thiolase family protein [Rhodococcus sp. LW-XY12]UQB75815.1 thiolase family protein [Rhodococcus ruber]UVT27504.1 thiolase family protein [Rhodococcus pyridinivorans]WML66334.1 thiolase family protein [Rhodococcus sp. AH-ZY2]
MRDVVIVEAVRSPIGRRRKGLADVHPVELAGQVLRGLIDRSGLDPLLVDDVIMGCVSQAGEQAGNIARMAALSAGWPESVPGVTVDRQCGSSQQAVHFAAASILSGMQDIVVAAGVESMTRVPMGTARMGVESALGPSLEQRYGITRFNQGTGADRIAEEWQLSRRQLDELSAVSHHRAAEAQRTGTFADEILPVTTPNGNVVAADEGIRPETTAETLAALEPAFGGLHTAGSASQVSDGAAALLLMTSERAAELGLTPMARLHSFSVVGSDPLTMLTGPIPATAAVLAKAGLGIDDIDTFEVNEAFASVLGAWLTETGADPARTNPQGGAIALGHPLGASGARLMTTMVHRMKREGSRWGLQAMCEGGGMANATVVEALA